MNRLPPLNPLQPKRPPRAWLWVLLPLSLLLVAGIAGGCNRSGTPGHRSAMSLGQALVLGIVEGVTEYLPVSSTGHLLLAQRAMGIGNQDEHAREAADAYAICIQAGAILAVLGLYASRIRQIVQGFAGRNPAGARLGFNLVAAFLPAAILGLLLENTIKHYLFGVWPIIAAWAVGGFVILGVEQVRRRGGSSAQNLELEKLNWKMAVGIGLLQCVAMWPGVSRSLATILGGLLVGLGIAASVEFSFLLGLITLSASTLFDAFRHGRIMFEYYGLAIPLVGLLAAMVSAAIAVKWMVAYLQRHPMSVFGYYRILLAAGTAIVLLNR